MPNKDYKAHFKFCDLEDRYSSWEKSGIAVLPVSYDLTTSYRPGASIGPKAIIDASRYLETYDDETGKEVYKQGIYTLEEIKTVNTKPEEIIQKTASKYQEALRILTQ